LNSLGLIVPLILTLFDKLVTWRWVKLYNIRLYDLQFSPNVKGKGKGKGIGKVVSVLN